MVPHSGLLIGNILSGENKKIYGIGTSKQFLGEEVSPSDVIRSLIKEFNEKHKYDVKVKDSDIILDFAYAKLGYAVVSDIDKKGMREFAQYESLLVDPVYSGRAAGGMLDLLERKKIPENANVLFLHTGGAPAIFTDLFKF